MENIANRIQLDSWLNSDIGHLAIYQHNTGVAHISKFSIG